MSRRLNRLLQAVTHSLSASQLFVALLLKEYPGRFDLLSNPEEDVYILRDVKQDVLITLEYRDGSVTAFLPEGPVDFDAIRGFDEYLS